MATLDRVKKGLGVTGDYQNDTLTEYINEVKGYLLDAGVPEAVLDSDVSIGLITRGVSDLWNYGTGKLSDYFYQRATQLVYAIQTGYYIWFNRGDYGISYPVNIEGIEIKDTDTVVFTCSDVVKEYTGVTNNCILVTFTEDESERFVAGTYTWTLKRVNGLSVVTLLDNGVLIVR